MLNHIRQQISSWVDQTKSAPEIDEFMSKISYTHLKPEGFLNQLDRSSLHQPTLVYVDLMVQDMREPEYFYSCLISKPLSSESEISLYKFGMNNDSKFIDKSENDDYLKVMSSRETVICIPTPYETDWVKKWKKEAKNTSKIAMMVEQRQQFKLGQQFSAVCIYEPENQRIYFIRMATDEEKKHLKWFQNHKEEEIDYFKAKEKMMQILTNVYDENYGECALYSMISKENLFISGLGKQIIQILNEFLPRVCHLKVKVPFKNSYFPYKNEESELIQTPLQLSNESTYVIFDFTEFSEQKQTKIQNAEIDNLKALKVFIEEGQTIYRWEYGESLIQHQHSGIIFKASQIFTPHFSLKESEPFMKEEKFLEKIGEEEKNYLRIYIKKCRAFNPFLSEESRLQVEELIKQKGKENLKKVLTFAKLNAMSQGRSFIDIKDYLKAEKLYQNVVQ